MPYVHYPALPNSLTAALAVCSVITWLLSPTRVAGQDLRLKSVSTAATEVSVALPQQVRHRIILNDYEIIPENGLAAFKLNSPASPVTYSTEKFNANKLAHKVLSSLRKAARASRTQVKTAGTYSERLLLRPWQLIGTKGYADTRAIRRQFRQQLAQILSERYLEGSMSK
ncbi:hypothetical protein [Hymenobacter metallicola]|uniref:Uncharacterized protein n=1 Tax=Hymenobacter metallicola TaxID=2563114 RepID=A0A4Z0Q8W9_9BACT|nr:hypothetical protein [Hymenobacter metallicola]TGE26450.1 hypothetical protein E5K02_16790 [Hymenobacter metallicola]